MMEKMIEVDAAECCGVNGGCGGQFPRGFTLEMLTPPVEVIYVPSAEVTGSAAARGEDLEA